jgi:hypothetical protein
MIDSTEGQNDCGTFGIERFKVKNYHSKSSKT